MVTRQELGRLGGRGRKEIVVVDVPSDHRRPPRTPIDTLELKTIFRPRVRVYFTPSLKNYPLAGKNTFLSKRTKISVT